MWRQVLPLVEVQAVSKQVKPIYFGRQGDALVYMLGECSVLLSGPSERSQIGWHFSIAHPSRYPTWDEQKLTRYLLVPDDVTMVQVMPPRAEYVNAHPNCFHWHEAGPKFFDPQTGKPRP